MMMNTMILKRSVLLFVLAPAFLICGCKSTTKSQKANITKNKCDLDPVVGPCKAFMPKYYYDKKEKKCKEFFWGGCDGVVPFETLEECEKCKCNEK